ncbi:MAG: glycine--tRNA ligase subunit beta [Pseudomonadota bacterium]
MTDETQKNASIRTELLIEIGTEELPPKALLRLSDAFQQGICKGLDANQLHYAQITPYASPRRLAMVISEVDTMQADRTVERRGPAVKAAFDAEGNPTKAAQGFAGSCGVSVEQLARLETDKGAWLVYREVQSGQATADLLPDIVRQALAALPIPKRMRWGDLDCEFVRPVHWAIIMLGEEIIQTEIMGIVSGSTTRGHRFHHPQAIPLGSPAEYTEKLLDPGYVMTSFAERRERIRQATEGVAASLNATAVIDEDLLDEVTALVEWPVAVAGGFEEDFLDVPQEALIAAMKEHQKYFHMVDQNGTLLPRFITISNIDSTDVDAVRTGNERVIRPRLSDAMFFWTQDKAKTLEQRLDSLKTVTYEKRLGSLYDKSKRIARLTGKIAKDLGLDEIIGIRAGQLSKCDLMTEMVGEFPELQGVMGEYYARNDGETELVATALREQYMPRFGGDELPATPLGQALALAERFDTLTGVFGIGQPPSGDKDPYGLRRAAIGALRIMIERELPLDLSALLSEAATAYPDDVLQANTAEQVIQFVYERMRNYYLEQGVAADVIESVLTCQPSSPLDADKRIKSVQAFRKISAVDSLAAANKRIHNILKKAEETVPAEVDTMHFTDRAERVLFDTLHELHEQVKPQLDNGDYEQALMQMANLREPVDSFFDTVLVMDENPEVRLNRLALLQNMRKLFLQVADISCLN